MNGTYVGDPRFLNECNDLPGEVVDFDDYYRWCIETAGEDGMSDVEADADTFESCGWGTDEDYGDFGGGEF